MDYKMAWRNIWRNPRRTILTVSGIAFACFLLVFIMSFQFGGYETMINSSVKIHTGHLQIQAKDFKQKKNIRLVIPDPEVVGNLLKNTPTVKAYTFRGHSFAIFSSDNQSFAGMVVGIDPLSESNVSNLKSIIRKGDYLEPDDKGQALVGEHLANNLRVGLGDEIVLLSQGREGAFAAAVVRIKGIYRSGLAEFDRTTLHILLEDFQTTFDMRGAVHKVVINAKSLADVADIKRTIQTRIQEFDLKRPLVVLDWEELMPGLRQGIQIDFAGAVIFYVVLIIVVAFGIMNTFLMAIFERTREFGILMAMGTAPKRLVKLLLMESMSMTMIGISTGVVLGAVVTLYFQTHGIDISGASELLSQYGISGRVYTRLSLLSTLSGPCAVLIITLLAALYPALKVRSLAPVEALAYV